MEAPQGLYGDLGTGGGFPGIPLAIVTGRDTVLVDSVQKKIKVLDDIVAQLGLSAQITSFAGRIEDLALVQKNSFSLLTARALSQLNSLLELASPLLRKHGRLVCYKAHVSDEELALAADLESMLGMKLISRRSFTLSDDLTYREILVYEKVSHPRIKLPRRVGLAQKKPLTAR